MRRRGRNLGQPSHERRLGPHRLERIEAPSLGVEDVHADVAEVDEHPAGFRLAVHVHRVDAGLAAQGLDDPLRERADLPLTRGGADDEEIGDEGDRADVENREILGLLVVEGLERGSCQGFGIQPSLLSGRRGHAGGTEMPV